MKPNISAPTARLGPRSRTYLLLAAAFLLTLLAQPKAPAALAAWLAPIFLLGYTRAHRLLPGMLAAYLVTIIAFVLGNWNLIPSVLFYPTTHRQPET
jgi:apolipoprotein N-acyltransferase